MTDAIKIIITLAIMLLLSYPFIPVKGKLGKIFVATSLKFKAPDHRKNIFFVILSIISVVYLIQ